MEYQPKILPKRDSQPDKAPPMVSLVLKPIGYPLRAGEEVTPFLTTDDPSLFQQYARSQWVGLVVKEGNYLFDSLLFPDYAFRAIDVEPNESKITENTTIILEQEHLEDKSLSVRLEDVAFSDIIGQNEAKEKCSVIAKFLSNDRLMNSPWAPRNILFWGPPGNGKTMMALALSHETNYPMFLVKASDILGLYVGDGARKIQKLFAEARSKAPSIIFIDELDTIALKRNYQSIRGDVIELVTSLLGELDGVEKNHGVVTIASTNQPEILDHAILSRFEQLIEFKTPTRSERREILLKYASTSPIPFKDIQWDVIVQKTKDWSGRDLKEKIIKNAIHSAILHDEPAITMKTMLEVLKRNKLMTESIHHYS